MSIGTSLGAYFDDDFHYQASQWDPKYDTNEYDPGEVQQKIESQPAKVTPVSDRIDVYQGEAPKTYDTPLTPEEQTTYGQRYGATANKDYDMQGYFKANPDVMPNAEGQHYPDTYKKPNHPTFSDESVYHGQDGNMGGHWGQEDGKDTFTPGPTNMQNWGKAGLQEYFKRVEPDVKLNMPSEDSLNTLSFQRAGKALNSVIDSTIGALSDPMKTVNSIAETAKNALTLPGDVMSGKIKAGSQEEIEGATNLAGLMVGAPAPVAAKLADGTLGSFAGVISKTADMDALKTAQGLEKAGATADDIWDKTGWFKSKSDSRWKYEISDEGMKMGEKPFDSGRYGFLDEFIDHPKLFEAYPSLRYHTVEVGNSPYIASYSRDLAKFNINPEEIDAGSEGILDVMKHEIQHAIQSTEGFSKGSNPVAAKGDVWKSLLTRFSEAEPGTARYDELRGLLDDMKKTPGISDYLYQRKPGEVEANTSMVRRKLTDEQRKAFPPWQMNKMMEGEYNGLSGGKYYPELNLPE